MLIEERRYIFREHQWENNDEIVWVCMREQFCYKCDSRTECHDIKTMGSFRERSKKDGFLITEGEWKNKRRTLLIDKILC